ncbi:MAG: DUF4062 domain-containing protein [Actinomycetota bacterium]|nr:DUF4062 domain-containing protein [Actinomycetota bacterium]
MKWQNVYVFISSTFNDMHAERDYLVKNVFPELSEWCEKRKLNLVDIDLRWGITNADSEAKNTVLACLNNIDKCRPFFLCFLGQRRGWVPTQEDIGTTTIHKYPGIKPYIGKNSVTEIEIEHALLSPMRRLVDEMEEIPKSVEHALFFFRNDNFTFLLNDAQKKIYTNSAEKDKTVADNELENFKKKVRQYGGSITEYDCRWEKSIITTELISENAEAANGRLVDFTVCGNPLKDVIIDNLKAEIEKEFSDNTFTNIQTELEADLEQQAHFIDQNREGFIPREGDFDILDEYINGKSKGLLLLTAPAGLGKTMLLANYADKISGRKQKIYARFCGVSDMTSDTYSLWKSIFEEANIKVPPVPDELRLEIDRLLRELAEQGSCIILIDGINQLSNGFDMLTWMPRMLPEGMRLIISLKEDEISEPYIALLKNDSNVIQASVRPFTKDSDKLALITAFLEKYLKALDDEHISVICNLPSSENPLYLKVILSELRVFGAFKQLENAIRRFGKSPMDAFDSILERLEYDPACSAIEPKKAVPFLFGLLSCTRKGLSEDELTFCFIQEFAGISEDNIRNVIRLYIRQLRPFLARREGRTDFLYESFMLAAKNRYSSEIIHFHSCLARCFLSYADPGENFHFEGETARSFSELPYHMYNAGDSGTIERMLGDYRWIYSKTRMCGVFAVISDYEYVGGDNSEYNLRLIRDSLILSAHVLDEDYRQLPSQLWGRLADTNHEKIQDLLIAAKEQTKEIWLRPIHTCLNTPGGALLRMLAGHTGWINDMTAYGSSLITASWDKTIRIWDGETLLCKKILTGHKGIINTVAVHEDILFSYSENEKCIKAWDLKSFICIKDIDLSSFWDSSQMNGSFMGVYAGELFLRVKNKVLFFDIKSLGLARTIPWYEDGGIGSKIYSVLINDCFYSCWKMVGMIAQKNSKITVSNAATGEKTGFLEIGQVDFQHISDAGDNLLAVCAGSEIQLWDVKSGECKWNKNTFLGRYSVSWKDKLVLSVMGGYNVLDLETGEMIKRFGSAEAASIINGMVVIKDRLFTIHSDERVRVWDLAKDYSKVSFANAFGMQKIIGSNEKLLATSYLKPVNIYDITTGKCITRLDGHTASPNKAVFDSEHIITGTASGEIKVWEQQSGKCIQTMQGPSRNLGSLELYKEYIIAVPYFITSDTVMFFNKYTGENVRELRGIQAEKSILYNDILLIYTGTGKDKLIIKTEAFDCNTGEHKYTLSNDILVTWIIVGNSLLTVPVSLEKNIHMYDIASGNEISCFSVSEIISSTADKDYLYVNSARVYEDKLVMNITDKNRHVMTIVIKLQTRKLLCSFDSHEDTAALLDVKNDIIHTASEDKTIKLWDISGKSLAMFYPDSKPQSFCSDDGNTVIIADTESRILQWMAIENLK